MIKLIGDIIAIAMLVAFWIAILPIIIILLPFGWAAN